MYKSLSLTLHYQCITVDFFFMGRMEVKFIFYHYLYVPKMMLIFQNIMRMHTVFFSF